MPGSDLSTKILNMNEQLSVAVTLHTSCSPLFPVLMPNQANCVLLRTQHTDLTKPNYWIPKCLTIILRNIVPVGIEHIL